MKTVLSILLALALAMVGLYLMGRSPQYRQLNSSPWDIQTTEKGLRVFGVTLGHTPLLQATAQLGQPEKVVVFVDGNGQRSAEAFFGKVEARGITGKLIARLALPPALDLTGVRKKPARQGGWKYTLNPWQGGPLADSAVEGISFLPDARGIPDEVLARRFGRQPEIRDGIDGNRILWFPSLRLRILVTGRGKMVLEYGVAPENALPQEQLDTPAQTG